MARTTTERAPSWWIGLDRTQLGQAVKEREPGWRLLKARYLDHIGQQMCGSEPLTRKPKDD